MTEPATRTNRSLMENIRYPGLGTLILVACLSFISPIARFDRENRSFDARRNVRSSERSSERPIRGRDRRPARGARLRQSTPVASAAASALAGIGPEVVPLSGGRLAEPARRPHSADLIERLG